MSAGEWPKAASAPTEATAATALSGKPAESRFVVLDGMRGVAAVCVMLYHFALGTHWKPFGGTPFAGSGDLAVDFFFMLSGFVLMHAYGQRLAAGMSFREFAFRRAIRLFPMYWIGLLLGVCALGWLPSLAHLLVAGSLPAASVAANALMVPSFDALSIDCGFGPVEGRSAFPANPPSWSLFFEMLASLSMVVLVRLDRRQLAKATAGAFALFTVLAGFYAWTGGDHYRLLYNLGMGAGNFLGGFPRVAFGLLAGLLLFELWKARSPILRGCRVNRVWVLYALLVLALFFPVKLRGAYPLVVLLLVAPALLIAGARLGGGSAPRRLSHALGWISYPLYCVHFPVGWIVFAFGSQRGLSPSLLVLAAVAASILVAAATARWIDEPLRAGVSRLWLRPSGARRESAPTLGASPSAVSARES